MFSTFQSILLKLFSRTPVSGTPVLTDIGVQFDESASHSADMAKSLNASFLISLMGEQHPEFQRATGYLHRFASSNNHLSIATFYLFAADYIKSEIEDVTDKDTDYKHRLLDLNEWLTSERHLNEISRTREMIWRVFFPEAENIIGQEVRHVNALREQRRVNIRQRSKDAITDPISQLILTSNVLLTVPMGTSSVSSLDLSETIKKELTRAQSEQQQFWYDHPIPVGINHESNEVLYGLKGLEDAVEFERSGSTLSLKTKLTCLLSASVTHWSLQKIARPYIESEIAKLGGLKHIDLFVFTEADTQKIINEILLPLAGNYLKSNPVADDLKVFGVDGEYGRHYSFLKAIAALWQICIDPNVKGTFKIDLDQVFPQEKLLRRTGKTAFEHFKTALWGASGVSPNNDTVELGMIAGALVNEKDIKDSLFTPDVRYPDTSLSPDEHLFFSRLPQALSTEAEMMTRYDGKAFDGIHDCIRRIHVTGGTNGILVDSLKRHRPFTPSFFGRAEDQAYLLSVFSKPGPKLGYLHKDGLIMRHDKEAFAKEAIESSKIGTLVGDYVRILLFSAYGRMLSDDIDRVKAEFDPFTGCFISKVPTTITFLRFALKTAALFEEENAAEGLEFVDIGMKRLKKTLEFVSGNPSPFEIHWKKEEQSWNLYYDCLEAWEKHIDGRDEFALKLQQKARQIISSCRIQCA